MKLLSIEEFQKRYNNELDIEIIELSNICKVFKDYHSLAEQMMDLYDFQMREPEEAKEYLFELVTGLSGFESLYTKTYTAVFKMLGKEIDSHNEESKKELVARCVGLWLVYEMSVDLRLETTYKDHTWFDAFGRV